MGEALSVCDASANDGAATAATAAAAAQQQLPQHHDECGHHLKGICPVSPDHGFYKSAQWSGDGTSLLAVSESHAAHVLVVPPSILADDVTQLQPSFGVQEAEQIYSACWYPASSLSTQATFCYLIGCKNQPIHLYDGLTSKVRASYLMADHRERLPAPHSMIFSADGRKIVCGTINKLVVFDTNVPGKPVREYITAQRKCVWPFSQKGIFSALAFSAEHSPVLAAGTYSGSIGLYAENGEGDTIAVFETNEQNGITQLQWSTCGRYLYVASRRSDCIEIWDIRGAGKSIGQFCGRDASTNQRIGFSTASDSRWMISGTQHGMVRFWDLQTHQNSYEREFLAAHDVINTTAAHPLYPLLAVSAGSRRAMTDGEEAEKAVELEHGLAGSLTLWTFDEH